MSCIMTYHMVFVCCGRTFKLIFFHTIGHLMCGCLDCTLVANDGVAAHCLRNCIPYILRSWWRLKPSCCRSGMYASSWKYILRCSIVGGMVTQLGGLSFCIRSWCSIIHKLSGVCLCLCSLLMYSASHLAFMCIIPKPPSGRFLYSVVRGTLKIHPVHRYCTICAVICFVCRVVIGSTP